MGTNSTCRILTMRNYSIFTRFVQSAQCDIVRLLHSLPDISGFYHSHRPILHHLTAGYLRQFVTSPPDISGSIPVP